MLFLLISALVTLGLVLAQVCPAPSVFITVNPANNNIAVSAGTSALVESKGIATFLTCATGRVNGGATATLAGGLVAAFGSSAGDLRPTLYVPSSADLVAPHSAYITVAPGATVSMVGGVSNRVDMSSGASGYYSGGFRNSYTLTSATATYTGFISSLLVRQTAGQVLIDSPGSPGVTVSYQGAGSLTAMVNTGSFSALQPSVSAPFQVSAIGNANRFFPGSGNTISASGNRFSMYITEPVETTLAGVGVSVFAYGGYTATITSGWAGWALSDGVIDVLSGGYGFVS